MAGSITDVAGLKVGHWTDTAAATGCTVVLCQDGAVGGVDVRGSAPGTRETDLLRPTNLVQQAHAVLLTGGSAYGLAAASGVMGWLEARGFGLKVGASIVPIVPAAVLFDLPIGRADVRPDAAAGFAACDNASRQPVAEGSIGAGTGATVGKLLGPSYATKGGLGSAARKVGLGQAITVGALVAVNAFGDVVDPANGQIIAGCRNPSGTGFLNMVAHMHGDLSQTAFGFSGNTTIAIVATDAVLTKEQANKVAQMAHDGLARAIRPVHTMFDGDTVFCLATGKQSHPTVDASVIGTIAAEVLAEAVVRAAQQATSLAGIPACSELLLRGVR